MAGEIAAAFIAIQPSMRGFGSQMVAQMGPQVRAASGRLGAQSGTAFGAAMGGAAGKASLPALVQVSDAIARANSANQSWLTTTAGMVVKNVTLYGSMYAAIQGVQAGVHAMFDAMVGFNAQLEQSQIGFTTLLKSAAAADDQMAWIKEFAKETPFQYQDLVGYSQQLIALGFNAEESRRVIEAAGDAAAALGRGSEGIARINLALGQMWTKGKVQSQEMLQLTEAGIGAWQILADAYGTSVQEVQDRVTRGLITAKEAVPALLAGMESQFGGLMEKQAETYTGVWSNIQDTLQQRFAQAGEPLFNELKAAGQEFLDALDDPAVQRTLDMLGEGLADGARALLEAGKAAAEAFRDALPLLKEVWSNAKTALPVLVGLAAAFYALKRASAGVSFFAGIVADARAATGAVATLTVTMQRLSRAGQTIGLGLAAASVVSLGDESASAEQKILGVAGAMGSAALAGASFGAAGGAVGIAAGAAIGAVVGLTAALVSLQQAQDAANEDTSTTAEALERIGVAAQNATAVLAILDNEQIAAMGGTNALVRALQLGGAEWEHYVSQVQSTIDALREAAAGADGVLTAAEAFQFEDDLLTAAKLEAALKSLAPAAADVAYAQYLAIAATNQATGAYGEQAAVAYAAAQALGAIPLPLLQTGVAAEGASGKVGYLLASLTGLPVNTPINFTTNVTDILSQIYVLKQAIASLNPSGSLSDPAFAKYLEDIRKLQDLQSKLGVALTAPPSGGTLSLPGGSGSKTGGAAAAAADAAAQKLKQDKAAQLRFADAFSAIMQAALEGNFDQFRDRLEDEIVSLTRNGYAKAAATLKNLSATLTQAALDYSALTNKINAATSAQSKLTQRMQEQYQTTVDLITGLGKVTDAQSFDQLAYLLGETTSAATQYQDILQQLKASGLSENIWNQLAGAGPESLSLAQSILAQGQGGIDQLNSLSGGLLDAADSMGTLVADSMYQQGIDAMQAYIDGLASEADALEQQLVTIANNILGKTAGAITPGNAGYSLFSAEPKTTANTYQVQLNVNASNFGDLKTIQDFIAMLEQAPTTQLVNEAGTVTS